MQQHSTFICDPHIDGCECQPKDGTWCNPYSVEGYCPTAGVGSECEADPSRLIRVPVVGGFMYGLRDE